MIELLGVLVISAYGTMSLMFFNDLDDIFIRQRVILSDPLRVILNGRAPDERVFKILHQGPVDFVDKAFDRFVIIGGHSYAFKAVRNVCRWLNDSLDEDLAWISALQLVRILFLEEN